MVTMSVTSSDFSSDLPVFDRRQEIVSAVDANQVTIIVAETGAGKSTQIPQYLADHGYTKVVVTQPRILAARNLARRVHEEWSERIGQDCGEYVGYRTAHERDDGPDTTILYCTDGLQLVREITGVGVGVQQVLVLDEIHEWNENMEVLVAWAKRRCQEDPHFKVVLMSATIEADTLARYFEAADPIIIPGRSYEVTKRRGRDLVTEIMEMLDQRTSNMLVFLPGKAEIEAVGDLIKVKAAERGVPVLPLHGQLDAETQQLAFASYPAGKVVLATNVAQTSVTIDDIDVVIDSGLERRSEVQSGVEGLFIAQTSQADCLQRAGRAGRTKKGEYILAAYDDMPCLDFDERLPYAVPEILRKHIDRLALRLANVGIDIERLEFYHAPSVRAIKAAKRTLVSLGAMTANGEVTSIGRQMEHFPVESSYARMLVEVQDETPSIQAKLAAIIAIQEVGGIIKGGPRYVGWRAFTRETQSDLVAQYDVYLALPRIDPEEYDEIGIIGKNVSKAREVMARLDHDLGFDTSVLTPVSDEERVGLLRCIVAGQIHQLWTVEPDGKAMHIQSKKVRELSNSTVVAHPKLVAGTPFDLQIPTQKGGLETLHLVQDLTVVDPSWLETLAAHLFKIQLGKTYFDPQKGSLAIRQLVKFNGQTIEGASLPVNDHSSRSRRLFRTLYSAWIHEQLEKERRQLQSGHNRRVPMVPLQHVRQIVENIVGGAMSLDELPPQQQKELAMLTRMQTYLGEEFVAKVGTYRKDRYDRDQQSRRSWRPQHKRKYDRNRGR
jgi:HrpA-like RNA helicase